jgi:gliding motility-associated-like protein
MEVRHIKGYQYRLILNLYFDEINALPEYKDNNIVVTIFEKGTNRLVTTISMPIREQKLIAYSIVDCQSDDLKISKILYYQDFTMDPAVYNHAQGYYAVWDRCCRNRTITNVVNPQEAGQVYYVEFPAVVQGGAFFKNSSPQMALPLSDYACLNENFTYDFSATDADGDELRYDLVTPLNGFGTISNEKPQARPGPYPEVAWQSGYNKDNAVPGNPGLRIDSRTGRLTVRPTQKGLFTFSVRIQEFRNGVKIGEVRRDMQIMVKECTLNRPPQITARVSGSNRDYQPGEVVSIGQTGPRCIELSFTDPDRNEQLRLEAKPVNFTGAYFELTGQTEGRINSSSEQETLKAQLCFSDCMDTAGKVYLLDVIVSDYGDRGCGLPKQDTVRLSFRAEAIPYAPPALSFSTPTRTLQAYEGETLRFDVTGHGSDQDSVYLTARGLDFDLAAYNASFAPKSGIGTASTSLNWTINCKVMERSIYQIAFTVRSVRCGKSYTKTEIIEVRPQYRPIEHNTVSGEQETCFGIAPRTLTGSVPTGGYGNYTYQWEVSTLNALEGFKSAPGENNRQHYFTGSLQQTAWFRRRVVAGRCNAQISNAVQVTVHPQPLVRHVPSADACAGQTATLTAEAYTSDVTLSWYSSPSGGSPLAQGPDFTTPALHQTTHYYVQATSRNGCPAPERRQVTVRVDIPVADAGKDVSIIAGGSAGLHARGGVQYQWSPAGSLTNPNSATPVAKPDKTTTYTVTITTQNGCTATDEVTVEVIPKITPANAMTLNGDGMNDTWHIENIEHYPTCYIQVFTRWGTRVFESRGYATPWDGTHRGQALPVGAYYYIIQLDEREKPISGSITLIK